MGLVPFYPNAVQVPLLHAALAQLKRIGKIRQIIFKCRQPGISTFASGIGGWKTFFFDNVNTFVIAHDKPTVAHIFGMYDTMYDEMSPEVQPERPYYNKGSEMVLSNRSRIHVGEAKNINVGTGRTIHVAHGSEICRWQYLDPIGESLIPALSDFPGTVQIWESTAHFAPGADWFRDRCERAMAKDGDTEYFFVQWWKLPEYSIPLKKGEKLKLDTTERFLVKKYHLTPEQLKWRREKIKEFKGDEDLFKLSYPMEYEEAWITKESQVFAHSRLMELYAMLRPPKKRFTITEGRLYENPQGEFSVWHEPEPGKVYFVGADVAEGNVDGDWSVAEVFEQGTNIQCAEYRHHLLPRPYGEVLAAIGRYYNNAQIAPEVNDCGRSTLERLREVYQNIYIWRKTDQLTPKLTQMLGWETSNSSKRRLVDYAVEVVWNRECQIFSKTLWDELRQFVRDYTETGQTTYHTVGNFDDCVMGFMICIKVSDDENFGKKYAWGRAAEQPKPKEIVDDAYRDTEWAKLMHGGKSTYEDTVNPWD